MKRKLLLSLVLLAAALRLLGLGEIPLGISLHEAKIGLVLAYFLGNWTLNAIVIRLPFALLGILSVVAFYYAAEKISESRKIALIATFLLAISPWHVMESRIFSPGILVFAIITLFLFRFGKRIRDNPEKLSKLLFLSSIFIFLLSLFFVSSEVRSRVDEQRHLAREQSGLVTKIFSNKYVENYRLREKIAFEHLDFGNFFFKGHPRQRGGVEETQKLYLTFIPLILFGAFAMKRKIFKFWLSFGVFYVALLSFFLFRGPSYSLPLLIPFAYLSAQGVSQLLKKKTFLFLGGLLLALESLFFIYSYFAGYEESQFTPRETIYENVAPFVSESSRTKDKVIIDERLENADIYFKFYLKDRQETVFEYQSISLKDNSDPDTLYIGVLPDEASPSEPLYKVAGEWPSDVNVIYEIYDTKKRLTVVVFEIGNNEN